MPKVSPLIGLHHWTKMQRIQNRLRGAPLGAIVFPGQEGTQPVLIEFEEPDVSIMGVILLGGPNFTRAALVTQIQALAADQNGYLRDRFPAGVTVNTDRLKGGWNLGTQRVIPPVPVRYEFEFARVFSMMSYRGWRDHFVVPCAVVRSELVEQGTQQGSGPGNRGTDERRQGGGNHNPPEGDGRYASNRHLLSRFAGYFSRSRVQDSNHGVPAVQSEHMEVQI